MCTEHAHYLELKKEKMTPTYARLLPQFISYKSISTDPSFIHEIEKTALWLSSQFKENGFDVKKINGYDNSIIVARYEVDPKLKTVLIYGHYDVQPADKEDGWESDPFTVTERNGRLYARGAVDNKGQVLVHIATVFDLIEEKKLKYNVVFMIEGNEESGSPRLSDFIKDHAALLASDLVLVSDGETTGGHPTLDVGFRGVVNIGITLSTSDRDLHSGLFGGAVPNSAQELSKILGSLWSKDNRVTIPEFYADAEPIDKDLADEAAHFPIPQEEMRLLSGCETLLVSPDSNFYCRNGLLPTLEITGIQTGYTGVGFRNSIPAIATAKINVRTAPAQDPYKQGDYIVKHLQSLVPSYAKATITKDEISKGILLDRTHEYMREASTIMNRVYKTNAIMRVCGATLPIAADFFEILGVPQVYASIGNEDCKMHAANENYALEFLNKGLEFSRAFLGKE